MEGLMLKNIWNGFQLKKDKGIKSLPLNVTMLDGSIKRVIFQDVAEFKLANEYQLIGTCLIDRKRYTFEYSAPYGGSNGSIIGFQPVREEVNV